MLHHTRRRERPRSFGRIVASVIALTFCAMACKLETKAIPATQVVVDVAADAVIQERTRALELVAYAWSERGDTRQRTQVLKRTVRHFESADEASVWPVRLVFESRDDDPQRRFELTATARGDEGVLGQARVRTGYVKNEIHHAVVRLTRACLAITCDDGETCDDGSCVDAWRTPNRLPLFPGNLEPERDAGSPDAEPVDSGVDGGADAQATDAASMDAGLVDAGAGAADAGAADAGERDAGPSVARCLKDNGGCDPNVTCLDTFIGVLCGACPNGFSDVAGDGTRCEDIDECARGLHACAAEHATCTNTTGSYECACADGFYGDGRVCGPNVPCETDPNVCDALATCSLVGDARVCVCAAGYEGSGGTCSDVDECAKNLCPVGAACTNTPGAFSCSCASGYVLVGGACIDVDECALGMDNCDDMPNACVNTPGGFACMCPTGYRGSGVGAGGCVDVDECFDNTDGCPSGRLCENHDGWYECQCERGYTSGVRPTDPCRDIDECLTGTHDCSENATCENTAGGHQCRCNPGFSGNGRRCERQTQ